MPPLLLDSGILSRIVRPEIEENRQIFEVFRRLVKDPRFEPCVPEIADYEFRRKLIHLGYRRHQARAWAREALSRLDEIVAVGYIPITTDTMRLAAALWAETRSEGRLRGPEDSLDVDVILAAQARQIGGHVVTANEKHFRKIADVFDWTAYQSFT